MTDSVFLRDEGLINHGVRTHTQFCLALKHMVLMIWLSVNQAGTDKVRGGVGMGKGQCRDQSKNQVTRSQWEEPLDGCVCSCTVTRP